MSAADSLFPERGRGQGEGAASKGIDSVLLIAFGGPERPEDVRPFLQIVTAGRRIPP